MPRRPRGTFGTIVVQLAIICALCRPSTGNSGSVSSSLLTFHEASCDGESMKMSCPRGTMITIQFAQYGRQVPSSQMCPHSIQADDPFSSYRARSSALWEDTNCLATTSLKVILDECQDKQQCHLVASTKTFQQDPCPGTRKYLQVAYKCRPEEFSSETVCEGDQLELRCSKSTRLAIASGMFGRTSNGDPKCPELLRNMSAIRTSCQSKVAMEELIKECQGRKSCTIEAEEYMFGNPCPNGVNKYLNVVYTCVPKRVLKPIRRHKHRKKKKKKPSDPESVPLGPGYNVYNNSSQYIPSSSSTGSESSDNNNNRILPHTTKPTSREELFPADAAQGPDHDPLDTAQQHPSDPSIGKSKVTKGQHDKTNKGVIIQLAGGTTPCMNNTGTNQYGPSATGLLTDWLNAFMFVKNNREKAILYLVLGVTFGVICLLFLVIIRLAIVNKRKSRATLDITEPTHEDHPGPSNHIEAPTLSRTDSMDRIEVVRFNPMRSRDFATCTLRSDIGNRSLTNYYG